MPALDGCFHTRVIQGMEWDSRIIESCTDGPWSHAEALKDAWTFGAQLKGGVCWRSVNDPCYRNIKQAMLIDIACTKAQEDGIWEFLLAQDGKPYDKAAIASFVPGIRTLVNDRNWRNGSKWFCDELLFATLERQGLVCIPDDVPIISLSPRDYWFAMRQYPNVTTTLVASRR